jgi:glyoxylase-like metal-dependent hydrolase (beta-lactamase superfamily II)
MSETPSAKPMNRRRVIGLGLGGLLGLGGWYAWAGANGVAETERALEPLPFVPPVSVRTDSGMRVHGIQTAWVAIKTAHYALTGPEALRLPSILADTRWTQPKPVLSWILEHPEGIIVVDSGEQAGVRDLNTYMACADPANRFIITRNFRLQSLPEMELGAQLRSLGLEARDVRCVVQTHLHFDHADGFGFVPKARVLVSRAELEGHNQMPVGAVRCKYPASLEFTAVDHGAPAFASFAGHYPLTRAGDVLIVPTPGHSYGHQSVVLRDTRRDYLFAGDVTFDAGQLQQRVVGGISNDVPQARASLERVRAYVRGQPVLYLPSHDPASLERLKSATVTRL